MDAIFLVCLTNWDIVWIQDIFYKNQAVIHAYNETLILSCCYMAAQLTSFDIFLVQRRPVYQMEYQTLQYQFRESECHESEIKNQILNVVSLIQIK